MKRTVTSAARSRAQGFSLIEALVALVVLSIGMLGIAALYVESLRAGKSALLRTQAVMLAANMADLIRANPGVAASYVKGVDDTGTVTAACDPGGAGCTKAQMAATDIARWHQWVDDRADSPSTGRVGLPTGRGTISEVDVAGVPGLADYTISVSWMESGQTTASTYILRFRA